MFEFLLSLFVLYLILKFVFKSKKENKIINNSQPYLHPNIAKDLYARDYIRYLLNEPDEAVLKTIPEYYKTRGGLVWSDEKQQYIKTPQRLNNRWYKDSYKIYGK